MSDSETSKEASSLNMNDPVDQSGSLNEDNGKSLGKENQQDNMDQKTKLDQDENKGEQEFDNIDDILEQYAKEGLSEEIIIESEEDFVDKSVEIKRLEEELEEKKQQVADYYSRYLRLKSEFDNFKKRVRREKTDIINYSNETLILEMLPILDNLERAIESAKKSNDLEGLVNGLEMIHKQKTDLLEKFGISIIPSIGEIFDPKLHEAFMRVDVAEDQDKRILSEIQKGYFLHEKVIRPARVSVGFNSKNNNSKSKQENQPATGDESTIQSSDHTNSEDT